MREQDNSFLALFPHRYDYIYAPFPEPGCKPNWHTESRHPLSDRIIQQGGYLYGVRFGSTTSYTLLDIDTTSPYHPRHDPFAISRIMAALEPLGLVRAVICTSSDSGGMHLYFPLTQALLSWQIARVMAYVLQQAGFKLYPGQLELFPNPKAYNRAGKPTLYHAHRLPLQIGSYLLNADLETTWSSPDTFVRQWCSASQANTLETKILKRYLKQTWQGFQPISGGAKKLVQDLNAEIEAGWSGYGQTNRLLGRIAMRTYIFHHILYGGEPLTGQALVNQIVAVAQSLPGYQDWCQHQHEITQRAADWARSVEKSHYFHYGLHYQLHYEDLGQKTTLENSVKPRSAWNQQQFDQTRSKIQQAVSDLQSCKQLPDQATARFKKLTQNYQISGSSLYRHRDLWHPEEFKIKDSIESCEKLNEIKSLNKRVSIETLENQSQKECLKDQRIKKSIKNQKEHLKDIKAQKLMRNIKDQKNQSDTATLSKMQCLELYQAEKHLLQLNLLSANHPLSSDHPHDLYVEQAKISQQPSKSYTSLLGDLGRNPMPNQTLVGFAVAQTDYSSGCNTPQHTVQTDQLHTATWPQLAIIQAAKVLSVGQAQIQDWLISQLSQEEIVRSHLDCKRTDLTGLLSFALRTLQPSLPNLVYGADSAIANHSRKLVQQVWEEAIEQVMKLTHVATKIFGETFPPGFFSKSFLWWWSDAPLAEAGFKFTQQLKILSG